MSILRKLIDLLPRLFVRLFVKTPEKPEAEKVSAESVQAKIANLKKTIEENPDDGVLHYQLGAAYMEIQRYLEAVQPLKQTLRINPEHASASFMLGKALIENGRDEDAVDTLDFARKKNPASRTIRELLALAHCNLTVEYGKMKQYKTSLAHYHQAMELVPDFGRAHLALAINFVHQAHYKEALKKLKETLRKDKNLLVDVYYYYGVVYGKLDKHGKAIKYYKKAIRVSPKAALCQMNLGTLYNKLGRYEEAIQPLRNAIVMSPRLTTDAPFQLGFALFKLERYEEAVRPLRRAYKKSPDHEVVIKFLVSTHHNIAGLRREAGETEREIESLRAVERVDPENVQAHFLMAAAYDKLFKGVDAVEQTIISKLLFIEQRDEKRMEEAMRNLARLYQKYSYTEEDFVNVKIPRKQY